MDDFLVTYQTIAREKKTYLLKHENKINKQTKPIVLMQTSAIFFISTNFSQYLAHWLGLPWIELRLLAVLSTTSNNLGF